jgi:hypothetical protein
MCEPKEGPGGSCNRAVECLSDSCDTSVNKCK